MPSIVLRLSDITPAKTAARKNFDGFKNKEGYQALAQGVGDASARLKEIVIERQKAQNSVIEAEFDAKTKIFMEKLSERAKAQAQALGRDLTEKEIDILVPQTMQELDRDLDPLIQQMNGGAQRDLLTKRDIARKQAAVQVRYGTRLVIDEQFKDRMDKIINPLIEAGDFEAVGKQMLIWKNDKVITEAYYTGFMKDLPRLHAVMKLEKAVAQRPGLVAQEIEGHPEIYKNIPGLDVSPYLKKAEAAAAKGRGVFLSKLLYADKNRKMGEFDYAPYVQSGIITQAQADMLDAGNWKGAAVGFLQQEKTPLYLLTAEQNAQVKAGNPAALDTLTPARLLREVTLLSPADESAPQKAAQLKTMLIFSDIPSDQVEKINTVIDRKTGVKDDVVKSISFKAASTVVDDHFLPAGKEPGADDIQYHNETMAELVDYATKHPNAGKRELIEHITQWMGGRTVKDNSTEIEMGNRQIEKPDGNN